MPRTLPPQPWSPTPAQLAAAIGKTISDVIAPGLRVLFCGINPSLYSAAVGHHFARPGNRFWPALCRGGLTPRLWSPFEDTGLLDLRLGLTNIVPRSTASADEISAEELTAGVKRLERKLRRHRPQWVAVLGVTAYRTAFGRPRAVVGPQEERLAGSRVWVLPNPSGLNANYQIDDLGRLFAALRAVVEAEE